jgi:hypothetical protein
MSGKNRSSGTPLLPALIVLLVLCVLGGFNYDRNLRAEEASGQKRPFSRYDTADLEKLQAAYRSELAEFERRYDQSQSRRQRQQSSGGGLLGERLEEFERIQRSSGAMRELNTEVAEREARLREIDSELAHRRSLASGWQLHLVRLVGI